MGSFNHQSGSSQSRPLSEINVTPLVDVMLVLLIVFMITAPMMKQSLDVNLPKSTPLQIIKPTGQIIITVTSRKEIYVEKKKVSLDKFVQEVENMQIKTGTQDVVLEADQSLRYGFITSLLTHLKMGGIERVSLATEVIAVKQ